MIVAPYQPVVSYDAMFARVLLHKKAKMEKAKDDALFIITGPTGSGKSSLALHGVHIITKTPTIDKVALTRQQFAQGHNQLKKEFLKLIPDRWLLYDETEANPRDGLSKWSKSIIRLYFTNRVFGGYHIWCNPSLHYGIDKTFVEERISGVFAVLTKDDNRPRKYVFYTKKAILRMMNKNIRLTQYNLKKYAEEYGFYIGWFRKYEGFLLDAYDKHKTESASQIDEEFFEQYGVKKYGRTELALMMGISPTTLTRLLCYAFDHDVLQRSAVIRGNGTYFFVDKTIEVLKNLYETNPDLGKYKNKATFQSKSTEFSKERGGFRLPGGPVLSNRAEGDFSDD